ncbi:MAG: carbamoyltransferase N-terminal domain-containing protein, partial [Candidatus Binatia bacterium]
MVSEERFTNQKNQGGFPKHAVEWILEQNSLTMEDLDYIAIPHLIAPVTYNEKLPEFSLRRQLFIRSNRVLPRSVIGSNKLIGPYRKLFGASRRATINSYVQRFGLPSERICQVEHHTAHAFAALYASGLTTDPDPILIFTSDDSGDGMTSSVGVWRKTEGCTRIQATQSFHSMGDLYARVTQFLGMRRGEHEYKIMGMAPYVPHEYSERAFRKFLEYINFDSTTGQI